MWIVYLIQHTTLKQIYIGITDDLKRRLKEHNAKGKKFTTRNQGEWVLIYAEAYRSKKEAELRERKLKNHGSGKHELIKRLENSLLENTKLGLDAAKEFK